MAAPDRPHRQPARAEGTDEGVEVLDPGPQADRRQRLIAAKPKQLFGFVQFDLPAELGLSEARYLLRNETGEPETIVVVRKSTVTVIDAKTPKHSPSKEEATAALTRALTEYGAMTGQPELEDVPASNWRSGYGEGKEVAEGKGTIYPTS